MRSRLRTTIVFVACAAVILACSSEGKVGEECGESGKTDGECEAGGICGKDTVGKLYCLKICTDQAQCASTEECNGVDGSNIKGCRPKEGKK